MDVTTALAEFDYELIKDRASRDWSDARVNQMRRLLDVGKSAAQIADALGGVTRNAVIGKLHRLGWKKPAQFRPTPKPKPLAKRPKAVSGHVYRRAGCTPRMVKRPVIDFEVIREDQIPMEQRRSLVELTAKTCRWPVGDPGKPDFFFCGGPVEGVSYCAFHDHVACHGFPRLAA